LAGNLAALLHRRRLEAAKQGMEGETLASTTGATCDDLAAFLANDTDDARIAELFAGLACVNLHDLDDPQSSREAALPPAFALLKIFFTSERLLHDLKKARLHGLKLDWLQEDRKVRMPREIPARLSSGDVQKAVQLAWQRLRSFGVKLPGRDPPQVAVRPEDGPRWLAALCIPLSPGETARLIRSLSLEAKEQPTAESIA
jgi:CRISPR-associated protein Csx17